jgi:hypothetical protein
MTSGAARLRPFLANSQQLQSVELHLIIIIFNIFIDEVQTMHPVTNP